MSRYCGDMDANAILEAGDHWRKTGIITDGSIFSNKSLWTLEHLQALDQYFINQPDAGEGNFNEKLAVQLAPTVSEVKQLAAELLWVMLLCPSNIGAAKKREGIQTIWDWSEEPFPADSPWLKDAVLSGVGSAGTAYNTSRWRELVFAIRVMIAMKNIALSERKELLNEAWTLAKWLEEIPECDVRQFRHMMLFLLFPDNFERIFGGKHRRKVFSGFSGKSDAQIKRLSAMEIDQKLASIREQHEQNYGTTELDFYLPPLRDFWGDARNVSWLLSWNPNNWKWESLAEDRVATHAGKTVTDSWACSNHNPVVGDKAYLVRTGVEPKGIIAFGNIVTAPYEADHWDEAKAAEGKTCWYVDIAFSRIQDPLDNDPYLTTEDLNKITIDQQVWFPQSSGIEIKQRSAGILKKQWDKMLESAIKHDTETVTPGITEATNLIFYGPPGTGKTYQLNKLIERYSSRKLKIGREAWLIQQLMDVRWFDAIFAALYDLGEKGKVAEITNHEFIVLKARAMGRHRYIAQTVWSTLQSHTSEKSLTVQYKNKRVPFVFDKSTDSIWSLVDDWQEECAEQVSLAKILQKGPQIEYSHQRYEFVTFHQAYSYEDFVEGIRPVQDDDTGELTYQVVPGVFRRIAQKAKSDPAQRYAILIDEINRGNIAKIFGELITLIEADKRAVYTNDGEKHSGMELTLPYSGSLFGVPKNLDFYGTMNTADRSIALLDTALRRRFNFHELMPDAGLISGSSGDGYIEDGEGGVINLRALLEAINQRIRFLLNRDMTLGHSYFLNVRNFSDLKDVFLNQLIPLLQEYFYEDWHRIQLVLHDVGSAGDKLEPQIIINSNLRVPEVLGFDHDDYEDLIEYHVSARKDIIPESIRKVYEGVA
ncbi:AAA family ATPase [Thermodesulfobacteriota bacterium]